MLSFHELIFDNVVAGTTPVYTAPKWSSLFASADVLAISCEVSGVTATTGSDQVTLTVRLETSADDKRYFELLPIVNTGALTEDEVNLTGGIDRGQEIRGAFTRLKVSLGFLTAGTDPRAKVKIWAIGRCNYPAQKPDRAQPGRFMLSGDNAVAVLTFDPVPYERNCLTGVSWSYSAVPASYKQVYVEDGSGSQVWKALVVAAGPGSVAFPVPIIGQENTAMIVTLEAGGAGVIGCVAGLGHFTEQVED